MYGKTYTALSLPTAVLSRDFVSVLSDTSNSAAAVAAGEREQNA